MSRLRGVKDLLQDGVLHISTTVERVHKNIAKRPFDILESIPGVDVPTRGVRVVHDTIVSGVYGSIRLVNRLAGSAADLVIDAVEAREAEGTGADSEAAAGADDSATKR